MQNTDNQNNLEINVDSDAPNNSEIVAVTSSTAATLSITCRQVTMHTFMKPPPSKAKTETITKLITNVIVGDLRPVSLVEGKHFKTLINHLEPSYAIPSRHTFTSKLNIDMRVRKPICNVILTM